MGEHDVRYYAVQAASWHPANASGLLAASSDGRENCASARLRTSCLWALIRLFRTHGLKIHWMIVCNIAQTFCHTFKLLSAQVMSFQDICSERSRVLRFLNWHLQIPPWRCVDLEDRRSVAMRPEIAVMHFPCFKHSSKILKSTTQCRS